MAYSGKFLPKNKQKYRGKVEDIVYRSLWERHVMEHLDKNENVKWWSSETTIIPYTSAADGGRHRYFMDFTVCYLDESIHLWEVKPKKQTQPPVKPKKLTATTKTRFEGEVHTWATNLSKWKAAKDLCDKKGWTFKILTEDTLRKYFKMKM